MSSPIPKKPETEEEKQIYYRDARSEGYYGEIWTSTGKCVFCDLRDKYIVFEENGVVLAITMYAYVDGDLLIIPRRHVENSAELTEDEWRTIRKLMHISRKMIKKVHGHSGVNYVLRYGGAIANNTVPHLHMRVIPMDGPDLIQWNYRKLASTPLENTKKYKEKRKFIAEQSVKFDQKYANTSSHFVLAKLGDVEVAIKPDDSIADVLADAASDKLNKTVLAGSLRLVSATSKTRKEVQKEEHLKITYPQLADVLVVEYEINDE